MKNGKTAVPKSVFEGVCRAALWITAESGDFDWWKHEEAAIFLQIYWLNPVISIRAHLNL